MRGKSSIEMQCVWKECQETWVVILALADVNNQVKTSFLLSSSVIKRISGPRIAKSYLFLKFL